MNRAKCSEYVSVGLTAGLSWLLAAVAQAGPNLMAISDYSAVPYQRATAHESFSGN